MKKEENSLEWIRHVRKKIGKKLLSLPTNKERVRYIRKKAAHAISGSNIRSLSRKRNKKKAS